MIFQPRELITVSSGRSNLSQMSDGSTQSSYVVTPLSTPRLHSVPSSSSEGQSKRVKLSAESEVITQSYWKGEQFMCIHSANDDHLPSSLDFQKSADYSLFRDLLSFLVTQQSLSLSVSFVSVDDEGHIKGVFGKRVDCAENGKHLRSAAYPAVFDSAERKRGQQCVQIECGEGWR